MASWSRTKRATNCATPRNSVFWQNIQFFSILQLTARKRAPALRAMLLWTRCKQHTVLCCYTLSPNCATPRNSVFWQNIQFFSILQLTARKRASALRAMLLWTRCKQHTVLICYTLSPNCATPRNSVFWQNIQLFSVLQLTAHKRASALRAMLLWTRCKQHTVLICYTLSPNCATPRNSVFWQNIQFFSILQLTARKRAPALRAMLLWTRCKQHTVLCCYTLSPNCATPRNSVFWQNIQFFSILQLTARKRASALRAMLLWTRCKQHTVLICYTLSPNCATPRNSVFWQNIQLFSVLQLTAHKRASALRAMLLWTRCKQHTVLICYTLSPNCAAPRY